MKSAHAYAELSAAKRLQVGAVLVKDDRIIAVGYNGMPSGAAVETCETEEFDEIEGLQTITKQEVCHAEMNVIAFAAKNGISTKGATLVVTHSPCYECAKLLIQAGITDVVFETQYRDAKPLYFLEQYGVRVANLQ